jgi:putative hydrolase of the HAD superfamily
MSHSYGDQRAKQITTFLFDYGGVLADEGFREGLFAIARMCGQNERHFFEMATEAVYETRYVTGHGSERLFWDSIRNNSGIALSDEMMRNHIISRFSLRMPMLGLVKMLRSKGYKVMILSDQTNWLKELDERDHFFEAFDLIFNSYDLGKAKRDVSLFKDILSKLGLAPDEVLFVDDNAGHTRRAKLVGINAITFTDIPILLMELRSMALITETERCNLAAALDAQSPVH